MARQRRGGFKPPELRGTLGTLLRTTLQQAGAVRDAITREGRSRLEDFRADRRRQEALAELGEIVLELVRDGEIDLGELPEARAIIEHLDELDAVEPDELAIAQPNTRGRFDTRDAGETEDGTVSALRDRKPTTPTRRPGRPTNVWRPKPDAAVGEPAGGAEPSAKILPRKGGISFDDEDLEEYMHPDDVPPKPDDHDG